eukprot:scaffold34610_cov197-Amphora_coffeaeformis.AAC.7
MTRATSLCNNAIPGPSILTMVNQRAVAQRKAVPVFIMIKPFLKCCFMYCELMSKTIVVRIRKVRYRCKYYLTSFSSLLRINPESVINLAIPLSFVVGQRRMFLCKFSRASLQYTVIVAGRCGNR